MVYEPPDSLNVNFSISGVYDAPDGNNVLFDLGGTAPHEIVSDSMYFRTFLTEQIITELVGFHPDYIYLDTLFDEHVIEPLVHIGSDNVLLSTVLQSHTLELLPDIICAEMHINVLMQVREIGGNNEYDLARDLSSPGFKFGYKTPKIADEHLRSRWDDAIPIDAHVKDKTIPLIWTDVDVQSLWSVLDHKDEHVKIPWQELDRIDHSVSDEWIQLIPVDELHSISYGNFSITDIYVSSPYMEPGPFDKHFEIQWVRSGQQTLNFSIPWGEPGPSDEHHRTNWGPVSYFAFCADNYWPPPGEDVNFAFPSKNDLVPQDGIAYFINFNINAYSTDPRCPYDHEQTGPRDGPGTGGPIVIDPPYKPIAKKVYYMLNTCIVKTVLTNDPIEVFSASATIDKNSWLWQFKVTIGNKDYLDLISPKHDSSGNIIYTDIEININGWRFICRVESWDETRVFGREAWSISGRSPSMELSVPQSPAVSYTYSTLAAGGQIIDDILTGTMLGIDNMGWSANWDHYLGNTETGIPAIHTGFHPFINQHWDIPANTFSWTKKTQIQAIQELTNSIGAIITTVHDCDSDNKTLMFRPLVDYPPWHWSPDGPYSPHIYHSVLDATFKEVGRSYESLPSYTAVHVMGQATAPAMQGNVDPGVVFVNVYRDGLAQMHAPQVTDPWITTYHSALERGRTIISDTGEWVRHRLQLFSLATYGAQFSDLNKLMYPGDYIEVNEKGSDWYGMISGTNITATVVAGAAVNVVQTIDVDEYIGKKVTV